MEHKHRTRSAGCQANPPHSSPAVIDFQTKVIHPAAIERGLAANPDAETKGILENNKALILLRKGDREGAIRLLGELALDPESTYATEHIAKVSLATIITNR